jgi:hypothetical protein
MRLFAAQLNRMGVSVLILPPVTENLAVSVLQRISRQLHKYVSKGDKEMFKIVADIQDVIIGEYNNSETGWETILDVCYFDGAPTSQ